MNRISLLSTLVTLIFASTQVSAQFTQSQMIGEWQRAKAYTKEYLDSMPPDDYAFKPTPEVRSFAQQMLHLADVNYLFAVTASGKASPFGENLADHAQLQRAIAQTKEAVSRAVMDSYDWLIATLQAMTPDQLQEMTKFSKWDLTRFGMYGKAFEHQTHHRGQMTIYFRLKGLVPPGEKLF
jgi:uncharacterized damage-inducible protein DinB